MRIRKRDDKKSHCQDMQKPIKRGGRGGVTRSNRAPGGGKTDDFVLVREEGYKRQNFSGYKKVAGLVGVKKKERGRR